MTIPPTGDLEASSAFVVALSTSHTGRRGLAELSTQMEFSAGDPDRFRATALNVALNSTRIGALRATPHRVSLSQARALRTHSDDIRLNFVRRGSLSGHQDGRSIKASPGTVFIVRTAAPFHYVAPDGIDLVTISTSTAQLSRNALRAVRTVTGAPLEPNALLRGCAAFLQSFLGEVTALLSRSDADAHERIFVSMLDGIVTAAARTSSADTSVTMEDETYETALTLAAELHGDPAFDSEVLAAEFDISLRHLQRLFEARGTTVAKEIRRLRLDALAADLSTPGLALDEDLRALVARHGFLHLDTALRAFKRQFGVSIRQFMLTRQSPGGSGPVDQPSVARPS